MERTSEVVTEADIARWYEGCVFSSDWTTSHFPVWTEVLGARRHRRARVLEIGSWEGRSALFFLHFLTGSSLTCVDTFEGSVEHHENASLAPSVADVERRFDANTARFADRIEKIRGTSRSVLPLLGIAGRRFDLVYVDGSHYAADVYGDAALSWSLVESGGLVVFDDYDWNLMETESERPRLGIETFLRTVPGQFREVHRDYQLIVEKL
ncbi:class I SAM-dependent methyltransferase [Streptomyces sedi]|uniref:Class I SAM-dependent methyltransferase n=1 Tax=Streptomyces sedi TaxID=555059 RepID=A0A5C4UR67_9ACTN|nr:class I SAM-dependent methyltransferase [Streptomyces sedi]TNM25773.1 class I SAM-dependent methyltransferase [Streptomyces sedi]